MTAGHLEDRTEDRVEGRVDLCEVLLPLVYGGKIDPVTVIAPGGWRGDGWPCPGRKPTRGASLVIVCTCRCHAGEFTHELPPWADRSGVHPTEVYNPDHRRFYGGGG